MYQSHLTRHGFTIVELLVVLSIIGVLAAVTIAALTGSRERSENVSVIRQVREYATALEVMFVPNGNSYIHIGTAGLNDYRCLVDTNGDPGCNYNGSSIPLYPGSGIAMLENYIDLRPLDIVVTDGDGHVYDSIMYSSDGDSYTLRYALKGENEACGFDNAIIVNTGAPNFVGVTICRFSSE